MITTRQLAEYLHLLPDNSEQLQIYIDAAVETAASWGASPRSNSAQYDLAISTIAATMYYQRTTIITETEAAGMRAMYNAIFLPLRYTPEVDADGETV